MAARTKAMLAGRRVALPAALLALWVLAGCGGSGPTADSLTNDYIQAVAKLAEVLEAVKDAKSAAEAAPQVKALAVNLLEIKKATDELGLPGADVQKALKDKYENKLTEATRRLKAEEERVAKIPDAYACIQEALKSVAVP